MGCKIAEILDYLNRLVWGLPALVLILGVGIYLSVRTGFAQVVLFPKAVRVFWGKIFQKKTERSGVSSYQALCTALAATVGTGNLAGVAGAIAIGGPGAVFWMWICGLLGMVIKFAEATLAVCFRVQNANNEFVGGPMYMISRGMSSKWNWMAVLYCFFGVVAAFGVGNAVQINAVIDGINSAVIAFGGQETTFGNIAMGVLLAVLVVWMLSGGAGRVGSIAERLVPAAAVFYLLLCIGVLCIRAEAIPYAFSTILSGALSPKAVTGGVIGSAFTALRVGAARGVFTNEAGMGTASIAHASADVQQPAEQGLMGIIEVFLDTIVICTMTALVILCSGVPIPYGLDTGMTLTSAAFASVYGNWICVPLSASVCCFAVATILGWGMYGARCAQYLFGDSVWKLFVMLQALGVILGAVTGTGTVWILSETVNGLMAIPNLIALTYHGSLLADITKKYKYGSVTANGGIYENLNQCQPVRTFSHAEVPSLRSKSKKERSKGLPPEYRSA